MSRQWEPDYKMSQVRQVSYTDVFISDSYYELINGLFGIRKRSDPTISEHSIASRENYFYDAIKLAMGELFQTLSFKEVDRIAKEGHYFGSFEIERVALMIAPGLYHLVNYHQLTTSPYLSQQEKAFLSEHPHLWDGDTMSCRYAFDAVVKTDNFHRAILKEVLSLVGINLNYQPTEYFWYEFTFDYVAPLDGQRIQRLLIAETVANMKNKNPSASEPYSDDDPTAFFLDNWFSPDDWWYSHFVQGEV